MRRKKQLNTWKEAEKALSSIGKLKILRLMLENPNEAFTKYRLEKSTGLKPVDVRTNLKVLIELEWITEYSYRPKTYKINLENRVVHSFSKFYQDIKYL